MILTRAQRMASGLITPEDVFGDNQASGLSTPEGKRQWQSLANEYMLYTVVGNYYHVTACRAMDSLDGKAVFPFPAWQMGWLREVAEYGTTYPFFKDPDSALPEPLASLYSIAKDVERLTLPRDKEEELISSEETKQRMWLVHIVHECGMLCGIARMYREHLLAEAKWRQSRETSGGMMPESQSDKLDQIMQRLDAIGGKIDGVDTKIDAHGDKVSELDKNLRYGMGQCYHCVTEAVKRPKIPPFGPLLMQAYEKVRQLCNEEGLSMASACERVYQDTPESRSNWKLSRFEDGYGIWKRLIRGGKGPDPETFFTALSAADKAKNQKRKK